ncbi:AMP-binding protein [Lujinxingia litoralis]|nr:AMP-binding protein [Lujinxingia litoralis]
MTSEFYDDAQARSRQWPSLFGLLHTRAQRSPARGIYMRDGRGAQEFRTYTQLLSGAERVAHALQERGVGPGERVLIAQPTGFDALMSFFGVCALGAIPVPLPWPRDIDAFKGLANLARWRRIALRYDARVLLCADLGVRAESGWRGIWPPHPLQLVLDPQHLLARQPARVCIEPYQPRADDVAYIQSTSGTTGAPRGVELTHRGLRTSLEAIGRRINASSRDVQVSWLPLDNIMGLVGAVFFAMHWDIRLVLMTPERFLAQPEDWFWAIHDHRATLSLAPNFAYNYCVRRCQSSALKGLDLSCWRIAMNGSEPVRAQHMHRFRERFKPFGLPAFAQMPVYGMSEATLGVSFHQAGKAPRIDGINRRLLEWEGRAEPLPAEGAPSPYERMHVVSVGRPLEPLSLKIVDSRGRELPERDLGEIAIEGPTVMAGYVASTVRDADGEPPTRLEEGWLKTGDLGYLADGDLFFVARRSDCIEAESGQRLIFPEEVELFVDSVDGVRSGSTAVFAAHQHGAETRIVVAFEVQAGADAAELDPRITALLKAHLDVHPARLLHLSPRTIPKTASGKVRRQLCAELYGAGRLERRSAGALRAGLRDLGEALAASSESAAARLRALFGASRG